MADRPYWSPIAADVPVTKVGPEPRMAAMEPIEPRDYEDLDLLAPANPGKVVAYARNYRDLIGEDHAHEEPLLFLMTSRSVVGPGDTIEIPRDRGPTWAEVELAFVVDKTARDVPAESAAEYIRGYTIVNDVTTENVLDRDWHLPRGKALDTYCPTGPHLVSDLDSDDLEMTTRINGETTQRSSTAHRILSDAEALSRISSMITLEPGDLVSTGTPDGALDSTITPGDTVELEIEGIGTLTNQVAYRS